MTNRAARRNPKREPMHPGEVLREDVLPALGMSVVEAAEGLRISRQTLHRILAGRAGVSPEMALRLGKFCGNGPDIWLRMQDRFDLWHAERAMAGELSRDQDGQGGLKRGNRRGLAPAAQSSTEAP